MVLSAQNVIYTRAPRREVLRILNMLPQIAAGQTGLVRSAQRTLLVRMGLAALARIRDAFVVKSHGGTDEAGESWKPLAKSTVAYSRRHPGVLFPGSKRAPYAPSWMLTKFQRLIWWNLYRSFGGRSPEGRPYHARINRNVTRQAAARAWIIMKAAGAKTLIGEYGDVKVDILRDRGLLLNTLSPGAPAEAAGPSPPPVNQQVFRVERSTVILGTNRKHAGVHHRGSRNGHVPQRRLWPEPRKWPGSWWKDILEQGVQGVIDICVSLLRA